MKAEIKEYRLSLDFSRKQLLGVYDISGFLPDFQGSSSIAEVPFSVNIIDSTVNVIQDSTDMTIGQQNTQGTEAASVPCSAPGVYVSVPMGT